MQKAAGAMFCSCAPPRKAPGHRGPRAARIPRTQGHWMVYAAVASTFFEADALSVTPVKPPDATTGRTPAWRTRSCRLRPSRSTDQAMTASNSRRVAARQSAAKAGRTALRAADTVIFVDLGNPASHAAGDLAQLAFLVGCRLVDGRDAKVQNSSLHELNPILSTPD